MNNRESRILEILTTRRRAEVTELSELLGVSQVTVRKDLDSLESTGMIKREHGFAALSSANDIMARLAYHYGVKQQIARKAAELVNDGESVMIESGSCCAVLAETLAWEKKGLTIITNSAFIADYIRKRSDFEIVLLGGTYQHDSQAMVGPLVRLCAENYHAGKFFIGVDGFSEQFGFTNSDAERAQAVRDMTRQAEDVVVLTESEKFKKMGNVPLNIPGKIRYVISDEKISTEVTFLLKKQAIKVVV